MCGKGLVVITVNVRGKNQFAKDVVVNTVPASGAKTVNMGPLPKGSQLSFLLLEVLATSSSAAIKNEMRFRYRFVHLVDQLWVQLGSDDKTLL
jgi:predicted dinucleotide-binding enzyme